MGFLFVFSNFLFAQNLKIKNDNIKYLSKDVIFSASYTSLSVMSLNNVTIVKNGNDYNYQIDLTLIGNLCKNVYKSTLGTLYKRSSTDRDTHHVLFIAKKRKKEHIPCSASYGATAYRLENTLA